MRADLFGVVEALDELPRFGPDADVACVFVHVDSTMVHNWTPLRLFTAFVVWGILPPRRGGQPLHLIYAPAFPSTATMAETMQVS